MANSWLVCRLRSTFGHMLLRLLLLLCWLCPLTAVVGQSTTQLIAEYKQVVRKNPTKAAQLARKVADEYLKKGPNFNARQGLRYAELSLEAAKRANSQTEQAETYFFIGSYKQQFDETRVEALRYLNAAYSLYSKLPKHDQTANVLYLLGITYDKEHEYYKAARVLETLIGFISEKNLKFPYENYARFKLQQTRQKAGIAAPAEQVIAAGGNDTLISTPGSAELVKLELEDEFKQRIEEMEYLRKKDRSEYERQRKRLEKEKDSRIAEVETEVEEIAKERERLSEINELQEERLKLSIAIAALALIVLFLTTILLIKASRSKKKIEKAYTELNQQNTAILEQKEEIEAQKSEIEAQKKRVEQEKGKSDDLLLNILPTMVATELREQGHAIPRTYNSVSILFTDFVGFTNIAEEVSPQELVEELDTCFRRFDDIVKQHRLEKIKTIGDAYLCAGGLPIPNNSHPIDIVEAGLEMMNFIENRRFEREFEGKFYFQMRVGIHTGPVVAGVVGKHKFAYDVWGDAVNTASRMESASEAGRVNVSGDTYRLVQEKFYCMYRGQIEAKNKGEVDMYYVTAPKV